MTELLLIRHAQSEMHLERPPHEWPLSAFGHEQARQMVDLLTTLQLSRLISSPLSRCLATIQPFAERDRHEIQIYEDLKERNIVNCFIENFAEEYWRGWDDPHYRIGNGETSHECLARFTRGICQVIADHRGERIGVSSHGNAISLFLRSLDETFDEQDSRNIKNPDVFHLIVEGENIRWNRDFELNGLSEIATPADKTPIAISSSPES